MKLLKRIKQKRCKNCTHKFKSGRVFCCENKDGLLRPLKLICFRYKKEGGLDE